MSLQDTNLLEESIANMEAISLEEMDHVKLMRRRDTKFVVPTDKLASIIELVQDKYKVLEIDQQRIHSYQTLYYDTPYLEMYQNHHNGRLNRYKVRVRKYLTSDVSFLEVKFKNNKRETIKKRIRPEKPEDINSEKSDLFL
ncbi:MAG: VTC domain-containing protein, partial [Bacteroidales bacterium]|nr:VTC domain-containing protein [Bacteroidales bacterium]